MHKKNLEKFLNLNKRIDNSYNISKHFLYELLLLKRLVSHQKISGFILNIFLNILNIITILKCRAKKIQKINYFAVINSGKIKLDNRSLYAISKIDLRTTINVIRVNGFIRSLFTYIKFPNVILYQSIYSLSLPLSEKKFKSFFLDYKNFHKIIQNNMELFEFIFKFLKIKKILMIDDARVYPIFLEISQKLSIKTYGYMHYKFSKYIVPTSFYEFDSFLVWTNFFKKKLISINKKYKEKSIYISDFKYKKYINNNENRKIYILFFLDQDLNFKEVEFFLNTIIKNKNLFEINIKFKPQYILDKSFLNFCVLNQINFFIDETLEEIQKKHQFDFFAASISTVLLESTLYNAIPLKLLTANDFIDDVINDNVVKTLKIKNSYNIAKTIIKYHKKKNEIINQIKSKVWSANDQSKKNNALEFVKDFLLN
jgi:hypothetical protein